MFDNEQYKSSSKLIINNNTTHNSFTVNDNNEKYVVNCSCNFNNSNNNNNQRKMNNKISTSKYKWYNCIPKIIVEQFSKMSNVYFLIIAIFQCIKEISNADGRPIIMIPLLIVVVVNGVKDFWEDLKRKKSDDDENNRNVFIYNKYNSTFEKKKWMDVSVGDIIKVYDNEYFPADCVLLASTAKKYNCHVETKNLDGETSLKFKKAIKEFVDVIKDRNDNTIKEEMFVNVQGRLITKQPNEYIYSFSGVFEFINGNDNSNSNALLSNSIIINDTIANNDSQCKRVLIENDSFLLRGCSLQQTESIYGLVVYVGHNTKIMKNSPIARAKISTIEHIMNMQIIFIFIFQAILSLLGASFSIYKLHNINEVPLYLRDQTFDFAFFMKRLGTWTVLLNNLVPISLLMTIEMVKYVQGFFISWDYQLYDVSTHSPAKVQTSTLNEELGQVRYIFSDKTGTLTKNNMKFKRMIIGDYSYGVSKEALQNKIQQQNNLLFSMNNNSADSSEEYYDDINIKSLDQHDTNVYMDKYGVITNFNFNDVVFNQHILNENNSNNEQYNKIHLFFTCLATCHSVITDEKKQEQGILSYQSSSPDETALLNCARYYKYIFNGRDINNNIFILNKHDELIQYKLLCNFPYTSERKRMSVVIQCPTGEILLFIKGADIAILPNVASKPHNIEQHINEYSNEGLRTLMIAYRELTLEEYNHINTLYQTAMRSTHEKYKLLDELATQVEHDLTLLGITGIEDELQDNVSDTIKDLSHAGIKIWVLTGDKKETAKTIGFSCSLLDSNDKFIIYDMPEGLQGKELYHQLKQFACDYNKQKRERKQPKHFALLISQCELTIIMDNDKYKKLFYSLASKCKTVLCCRVTPKQKAQMVNLIKQHQPSTTTLAIGDGANDVNMITSANIGIGIIGVEGKQAARASDYAIGQFQFLKRLLFIHGRESYRKNSFIVVYNFYKNFLFVIPQFILGFESLFGGQTIYEPFIYQLYNILFAAFPIIWFGIYDRQLSDAALMNNPKHYTQGIVGKLFGKKRFWKWILYGLIQALILYVYLFRLITMAYNTLGDTQDLKLSGSICYSAVVVIVNVKVIQTTSTHSVVSVVLVVISIMLYFIFIAGMNEVGSVYNCGNFGKMVTSLSYYLKIGCVVVICTMIDVGMKYVCKYWQCGANAFEYYNCNRLEHSMEMPVEIEVFGNVEHENEDVNEDNDDIELSDVDDDDEL